MNSRLATSDGAATLRPQSATRTEVTHDAEARRSIKYEAAGEGEHMAVGLLAMCGYGAEAGAKPP